MTPPPPPPPPPSPTGPPLPPPRKSRGGRQSPLGVLQVDWPFFGELGRALALKVFREYDPHVVIGIAKAGGIPDAVVASTTHSDFASMAIAGSQTGAHPALTAVPPRLATGT